MPTIGKVQTLAKEFTFEWKIDNFLSLSEEFYICPSFSFAGESWYLAVYPTESEYNSTGYIGAYLFTKLQGLPIRLAWSLGVKTFQGKKYEEMQFTHVFKEAEAWGTPELLKRSLLSEYKSELLPSDVLTLVCHIDYCKSSDDAGNTVITKCSYCKQIFGAEYVSSHEEKCLFKPIRCPTCGSVVPLRKWIDHECDAARVKATEKLLDDWTDILESGEHSDVTVRVKDKEFRLHRSVLAARNPYFSSMFKTEMIEKTTGMVYIDDCEPEIFHSFINFMYTGKVTLSCDNVCALYEVADKYQEDQLIVECLCYMKNKISVDSFCNFLVLALKNDEKDLLQTATDLFCRKIKEIIQSVKWQIFMSEYPTQTNELHIKALDYYVK